MHLTHYIKIMGIDPSLRNTGMCLALVNADTGAFTFDKIDMVQTKAADKSKLQRQNSADLVSCRELYRGLHAVVAEWDPDLVTGEVPTGAQSARAALSFGMSTMLLATVPVPIIEVTPREVKLASVGRATASKDEMMAWAREQAPALPWKTRKLKGEMVLTNDNEHMADACAAVAACVETVQFAQLMALWSRRAA